MAQSERRHGHGDTDWRPWQSVSHVSRRKQVFRVFPVSPASAFHGIEGVLVSLVFAAHLRLRLMISGDFLPLLYRKYIKGGPEKEALLTVFREDAKNKPCYQFKKGGRGMCTFGARCVRCFPFLSSPLILSCDCWLFQRDNDNHFYLLSTVFRYTPTPPTSHPIASNTTTLSTIALRTKSLNSTTRKTTTTTTTTCSSSHPGLLQAEPPTPPSTPTLTIHT